MKRERAVPVCEVGVEVLLRHSFFAPEDEGDADEGFVGRGGGGGRHGLTDRFPWDRLGLR